MAESKPDKEVKSPNHHHKETHGLRKDIDENTKIDDVKGPNIFERAKEEIEALVQTIHHPKKESPKGEIRDNDVKTDSTKVKKHCHTEGKTHGKHDDIDEKTEMKSVKAPNVFERAKDEIDALVQTIHHKKESKSKGSPTNAEKRDSDAKADSKLEKVDTHSGKEPKSPNLLERTKEGLESIFHKDKSPHRHHKETHGKSNDFDENTEIEDIKGPGVFHRAKEEIEAIVEAIHPKKETPKS